jgi:predicted extracellular nuclease
MHKTSTHPLRLTVLAALLAGLSAPALAASDLVISQVYGGGGNSGAPYKNDFIEIFNRGSAPVDLNGKSVQYASASGSSWTNKTNLSGVIQPGQYFLIGEGAGAGAGVALPATDASGAIAMSASNGKVALVDSTTALTGTAPSGPQILDMLAFGSATPLEGSATPALSNSRAAIRTDACTDTDDNSADFTVAAPAPRNSGTTLHACAAINYPIVPSCPASFNTMAGTGGSVALGAADQDGIVNGAVLLSDPVPGITLQGFAPAGAVGASASATLVVDGTAATGSYPVTIQFSNADGQQASCTVPVKVQSYAAVTVPQVQGSGAASPFDGELVTTRGVVTAKVGSGFFIQDQEGDGDPTTSDGVFVFSSHFAPSVNVGDLVQVWGKVTEYTPTGAPHSVTELSFVDQVQVQGSGYAVTPANLGDLPDVDLTQYEGMLVHFVNPLTITQSEFVGSRGELSLSSGDRLEVPTNRYPAGSPEAQALAAANARNLLVLDDGLFVTPPTVPYLDADHTRRTGDLVTDLTGVLDFGSYGGSGVGYKLQPTVAPEFSSANARPAAPDLAPGNVRVASANMLNFFTEFGNGTDAWGNTIAGCYIGSGTKLSNCRGADNLEEFQRQTGKMVAALRAIDADAYGLMEVQNNHETTVNYIVDALNQAAGSPLYAAMPAPADTADGPSTGTDAIRVAIIYKPSKLTPVGPAMTDPDRLNNRAPMAVTFKAANGGKFALVVNHFRAKSSCKDGNTNYDPRDWTDPNGQGCWNQTRINQANRLTGTFLPEVRAAGGTDNVLVVGDLNANGHEDPILALQSTGLVNEIERFVRPRGIPHSFVFGHQSGYLDHALASPALDAQIADLIEFHNNADEPSLVDYNLDGRSADEISWYAPNPYRASDHDPVVVSLNLAPGWADVSGSFAVTRGAPSINRITGRTTGSVTLKNTSAATVAGPVWLRFDNLTAGATVVGAAGTSAGAPYVAVTTGAIAPGASVTITTTFEHAKTGVTYTPTVLRGDL